MTIEDIFSQINNRMIEAEMLHSQMAEFYDFFGYLNGFKRLHEYRMFDEICERRSLVRYYINHYNRMIKNEMPENPDVVPQSLYSMNRYNLNGNSKTLIKNSVEKWRDWEIETKEMYENMYYEAMQLKEISACTKIKELVCGVDEEVKNADRLCLKLNAMSYDLSNIALIQDEMHDKYKEKTEKVLRIDI